MKTLLLTQDDVRTVLTMESALAAVEASFLSLTHGEASMPPCSLLSVPGGSFRAMPAYIDGVAGMKWMSVFPNNRRSQGLPTVMGLYVLSDPETAAPLAVMDATLLTSLSAGASAAVASRFLARPPRRVGFVGCGVQARFVYEAHREVFGAFEVLAADVLPDAAARLVASIGSHARVASIEEASGCDIVCTSTPAISPVVMAAWLAEGAHINALGADAPGKQELEPKILVAAKVVVDDRDQAELVGEVACAIDAGTFRSERIYGTLGEIIAGKKKGREGSETSVFDATGLAVQDAALARLVYRAARAHRLGQQIAFAEGLI